MIRLARRRTHAVAAVLLAVAAGPSGSASAAARLYVSPAGSDRADCSRHAPCRGLERADALARPGTTVHVAPGSYARATLRASGTRLRPIRFVSERRWKADVVNRERSPGTILAVYGRHVELRGFEVTSAVPAEVDGIGLAGSGSRAIGNHVHNLARPCAPNGGIVAGDARYAARGMVIARNYVHDIGRGARDGSCSLLHGIYAAVPRVRIVNNVVARALGDGITSWHAASALTIVNNTVVDNGADGILIGNGDMGGTAHGNTGTYVANNVVVGNHADAVSEAGPRRVRNTYARNVLYGNGRDIVDQWGRSVESGTLTGDPLFSDAARDGFFLLPGSPALASGAVADAPRLDFLGVLRGRSVSRGAFEEPCGDTAR
jgi:hypothetical protein